MKPHNQPITPEGPGTGMKPSWSVADVLAERPCLTKACIRGHFAGRETLTIQDILRLPNLKSGYKVWMACCKQALPDGLLHRWQIHVLTRIITRYALPHASTHAWAARWLSGEDRTAATAATAAWAAKAAEAAWAAWAAWAAGIAGIAEAEWAAWAAEAAGIAEAEWAAWAAEAAEAAEYQTQVFELLSILNEAQTTMDSRTGGTDETTQPANHA